MDKRVLRLLCRLILCGIILTGAAAPAAGQQSGIIVGRIADAADVRGDVRRGLGHHGAASVFGVMRS